MALITGTIEGYGWGDFNKVTDEALQIRYIVDEGITVTNGEQTYIRWKARRFATKRYRFVGMDETTARRCAAAKVAQYTRKKVLQSGSNNGLTGTAFQQMLQADIRAVHDSGRMWHVEIQINETDEAIKELLVNEEDPTPSMLFVDSNNDITDSPSHYDE